MAKVRTTLTIDEDILKWVKIRTGVSDSAVIEESLGRDFKLDVLEDLWANAGVMEAEASELAVQPNMRPGRAGGHLVRAVVDVNVLISGVLSATGALGRDPPRQPRRPIRACGLREVARRAQAKLGYPKLRKRIPLRKRPRSVPVRDHGPLAEDPAGAPPVAFVIPTTTTSSL